MRTPLNILGRIVGLGLIVVGILYAVSYWITLPFRSLSTSPEEPAMYFYLGGGVLIPLFIMNLGLILLYASRGEPRRSRAEWYELQPTGIKTDRRQPLRQATVYLYATVGGLTIAIGMLTLVILELYDGDKGLEFMTRVIAGMANISGFAVLYCAKIYFD